MILYSAVVTNVAHKSRTICLNTYVSFHSSSFGDSVSKTFTLYGYIFQHVCLCVSVCVCVCVYVFSCTCTLTLFQVQHGKLLCSFNSGHTELCVVQLLKAFIAGDEPILNEQDCPLIQSTNIIMVINSKDIVAPVSLVHQCTSTCKFSLQTVTTTIERKSAEQNRLIFKHDFINDSINNYCMK